MISFQYEALDGDGNLTTGLRVARDEDALHQFFNQQGLTPVSLQKQSSYWIRPISHKATLARFFRNLNLFLESGMELLPALQQVENRIEDDQLKACVDTVIEDLKRGRSLGNSLQSCEPFFPPSAHRICSVGETTGNLAQACDELSEYFKSQHDFLKDLYSLCLYPLIVIGVGFLVLAFILLFVVPRITQIIPENQSLPLISQIVFGLSDLVRGWGIFAIPLGVIFVGATIFYAFRTEFGQKYLQDALRRFTLYRKIKTQLFCLAMSMCTRVGLDMKKSLDLGKQVLGNQFMMDRMQSVIEDVRRGHTLTDSLAKYDFDLIPLDSLQAGENSGNLGKVFRYHSEILSDEIDENLSRIITIIEPVIVLSMAVFVGLIMTAVMLPIFEMSSTIQ